MLRMDAEGCGGVSAGGGFVAGAEEFFGEFGVSIGIGRMDAEGGLEGANGGGGVVQAGESEGEIVVGLGEVGLEFGGFAEGVGGVLPAALAVVGEAELDVALEGGGAKGEMLLEEFFSFGAAALLDAEAAHEEERFGVFRSTLDELREE